MVLKYYYDLLSQPSRAVYIFLKMNKIPFEPAVVNLGGGEHLTEEFREKHSKFQKVPFIHHDDFRLTERMVICEDSTLVHSPNPKTPHNRLYDWVFNHLSPTRKDVIAHLLT